MNYYSLSLLNNRYCVSAYYDNYGNVLHRDRLSGVISKGRDKSESALVIGYELDGVMHDIVTGKEVMYSSIYDAPNPNLCYYSKKSLSKEEVLNELKKLKVEDIKKYTETIRKIEQYSIDNYERYKKCINNISNSVSLSKVI